MKDTERQKKDMASTLAYARELTTEDASKAIDTLVWSWGDRSPDGEELTDQGRSLVAIGIEHPELHPELVALLRDRPYLRAEISRVLAAVSQCVSDQDKRGGRATSRPASLTQPLKWFGGKDDLAKQIVRLFPRHLHYCEPYLGGGAVLLERDPNDESLWLEDSSSKRGVSEVVGDLNGRLVSFWRVLRDRDLFPRFAQMCQATPLSREVWEQARDHVDGPDTVLNAWAFFVHCRQSRAGGFKGFTSLTRSRTRRGINGNASEWLSAVEGLAAVHARLSPVIIEHKPALELIQREDTPHTLFYIDAPYVHDTRTTKDGYAFEMSDDDHRELIDTLLTIKGQAIVSMYHHPIYDVLSEKHGWLVKEWDVPNNTAGGETKKRTIECCWLNYPAPEAA
jgi:DNA adenine methylase